MNKDRKEIETKTIVEWFLNLYLLALLPFYLFTFLPSAAHAQGERFLRYNCIAPSSLSPLLGELEGASAPSSPVQGAPRVARLPDIRSQWDSTRIYPVAVILVQFADKKFSVEDPIDRYNRMFNEEGYNEGAGPGCVAEYFRTQSSGLFNPRFDIYGPINVSTNCTANGTYGQTTFRNATLLLADSLHADLTPYDWDGDGRVESIVFIYAGYGGNESANKDKGYIWPNTGSFATLTLDQGQVLHYSASAELWSNDTSCGIGTICHEYSHTLGIPDIYPTGSSEYSVCDEWDLMDGGNFINNGWCPPNYSPHQKMQLNWLTPEVLDEPATIQGLKPIAKGGKAFIIPTEAANEFYLLENRQWNNWDLRIPGHGLLIYHIDYSQNAWDGNNVNSNPDHHRYDIFHADNLNYAQWDSLIEGNPHRGGHSLLLSGTAYPLVCDSAENRQLTDESTPAAMTFCGSGLLSKPITAIREADDGTISFHFMGGDPSCIRLIGNDKPHNKWNSLRDLQGRPVTSPKRKGLYILEGKKYIHH